MPGLFIPIGGGRGLGAPSGIVQSGGATIAQTAYGAEGIVNQDSRGGVQTWHVVTGSAAASLAFLALVRHSLPSGMKRTFDLVVVMGAPAAVLYGTVGLWSRHYLIHHKSSGVGHGTAKVVKALTP